MITLRFADPNDTTRLVQSLLTSIGLYSQPDETEAAAFQGLADALGDALDGLPDDPPAYAGDDPRVVLDDGEPADLDAVLAAMRDIDDPTVRDAAAALDESYRQWRAKDELRKLARAEVTVLERQLAEARKRLHDLDGPAVPDEPAPAPPAPSPDYPLTADGAKGMGLNARDVRAWAKRKGVDCPQFGRVPTLVLHQYIAAHQGLADG